MSLNDKATGNVAKLKSLRLASSNSDKDLIEIYVIESILKQVPNESAVEYMLLNEPVQGGTMEKITKTLHLDTSTSYENEKEMFLNSKLKSLYYS